MYRFKKDSWKPARFRRIDYAILLSFLIGLAFVRGLDYMTGNDQFTAKEYMTEAAPEWLWGGGGFILGASILLYGVISRRHLVVYIGHWWLFIVYLLNSCAILFPALSNPPYFDGVRSFGPIITIAMLHFLWIVRMGAHPIRTDHPHAPSQEVERIVTADPIDGKE